MSRSPVVWLIDAHYQIFRAYHSLPDMRSPDGRPVAAVRGYAQTLIKFLREQRPAWVAAAFDFSMTSFRNELYAGYKQGRTEAPPDLEPQFAPCEAVTRALGIPVFSLENYEADDLLATLVARLLPQGARIAVITRDKDLGALVSERVTLFDLKTGRHSGPEEVKERLGVAPPLVSEWLALVGDAVDGIPGVPGIGAKTGAALLEHFGSLDAISADEAQLRQAGIRAAGRVARSLTEHCDTLAMSRELARLRSDLPLRPSLEDLAYKGADRGTLVPLLEELGAASLASRVPLWCA